MTMKMKPVTTSLLLVLVPMMATTNYGVAAQSNPRPIPGTSSSTSVPDVHTINRQDPNTCPQMPTLHCKNGSTCEQGIASWDKRHDHLDLQTHESGWYCKCAPGYIGHECGIQVDDCEGEPGGYDPSDPTGVLRSCYHGSQCRSNGNGFFCDCNKLNARSGATGAKYAGLMCQHESTSLCAASLAGNGLSPNSQFCTNHGKCVKMVTGDEPHPGCVCREGWMGDRCEVRDDPLLTMAKNNPNRKRQGNAIAGTVLFSLIIVAMVSITIWAVIILAKAKRREDATEGDGATVVGGEKKTVGVGDLEADGSATLGNRSNATEDVVSDNANFAIGDLEMTVADEDEAPAEDSNEREFV
eukprot:CAMPEP_0172542582 /NCGR_PEP_ID=MMETSP1067-20121228/13166_1 /TAXON_ID=265564 ORGANISM="Thalassiosira punctigera, Strain Tpunct2005C2" /NCGR_SAMPLE_ID=MMETSP1067 /ASSEMBLY_ACC=CAM_ASM_000444 /LENGTH=354 /DNA_ID=CAMNT_0013328853 /DNA_START=12 /DNA_END=1076 /DNA_ORIENTATION=+